MIIYSKKNQVKVSTVTKWEYMQVLTTRLKMPGISGPGNTELYFGYTVKIDTGKTGGVMVQNKYFSTVFSKQNINTITSKM